MGLALAVAAVTGKGAGPGRCAPRRFGVLGEASLEEYAAGGAATSFTMLVAARACPGAFGALLAPAALALLTTTFSDEKERARRSASSAPSPAPAARSAC